MKKFCLVSPIMLLILVACASSEAVNGAHPVETEVQVTVEHISTIYPTDTQILPSNNAQTNQAPTPIPPAQSTATTQPTSTPSINQLFDQVAQYEQNLEHEVLYFYSSDFMVYGFMPLNNMKRPPSNFIVSGSGLPFAKGFSFANFAPLIAYIDRDTMIWISDIGMNYPVQIDNLTEDEEFQIAWSPDDRYVFIFGIGTQKRYLLDVNNTDLIEWPYSCTILAKSPKTGNVATWCNSEEDDDTYAVMDWGNEIWYTNEAPEEIYLKQPKPNIIISIIMMPLYLNAGWSSDGKQIAYFDLQDQNGSLIIIADDGTLLANYHLKAYWLSPRGKSILSDAEYAISWSQNNQVILIYGIGHPEQSCPPVKVFQGDKFISENGAPCWQVVDAQDGTTIWMLNDLLATQTPGRNNGDLTFYDHPALSTFAEYITIYSFAPADYKLFTMDLATNELVADMLARLSFYRWGPSPP